MPSKGHQKPQYNAGLELILAWFAPPGQVIYDPIMLSQASAALSARKLGCPFIGADREASSIARVQCHLEREEGAGDSS